MNQIEIQLTTVRVVSKMEGVPEYSLQEDGSWKQYSGDTITLPLLLVTGPDSESIALYMQELRDKLGLRDTHNVRLWHCVWESETSLRVSLCATPIKYESGKTELVDVLLQQLHKPVVCELERSLMGVLVEQAQSQLDLEYAKELCSIVAAEAEE